MQSELNPAFSVALFPRRGNHPMARLEYTLNGGRSCCGSFAVPLLPLQKMPMVSNTALMRGTS